MRELGKMKRNVGRDCIRDALPVDVAVVDGDEGFGDGDGFEVGDMESSSKNSGPSLPRPWSMRMVWVWVFGGKGEMMWALPKEVG